MVSDQELAELQKQRGVDQRKRESSFLEFGRTDRLIFLRNGAFLFNIDENLENPGTFRTEMLISSWAEHLQQLSRMTKSESEIFHCALAMHVGSEMPIVRHYLRANRSSTPLGFGQYRKRIDQ